VPLAGFEPAASPGPMLVGAGRSSH